MDIIIHSGDKNDVVYEKLMLNFCRNLNIFNKLCLFFINFVVNFTLNSIKFIKLSVFYYKHILLVEFFFQNYQNAIRIFIIKVAIFLTKLNKLHKYNFPLKKEIFFLPKNRLKQAYTSTNQTHTHQIHSISTKSHLTKYFLLRNISLNNIFC